ncbi:MAG TPA: hypothetical protein VGI31_03220 [Streptosporangiaceae bacterium]
MVNTTGNSEGGETPPPAQPGSAQPGNVQPGSVHPGSAQPGNEGYEYTGSYGYGPGYGDPDGGGGYGYAYAPGYGDAGEYAGAGQAAGPEPEPGGQHGRQPGDPAAVSHRPLHPVVGATPALKGYPGGPGLDLPENGLARRDSRNLRAPSAWQLAQRAWLESGVEWQRPAAGAEPAEAEWDRLRSAPSSGPQAPRGPGGQAIGQTVTSSPGRVPGKALLSGKSRPLGTSQLPGKSQPSGRSGRPGLASGGALHVRRGVWQAALAVIVVLALVIAGFLLFGGGSGGGGGKPAGSAVVTQYPPARPAGAAFSTDPAQQGRGIFQSISGVAASSGTIVAAGSEAGEWVPRAQFVVSVDGGHSWRLAPVLAARGKVASPANVPKLIAGGPALPGGQGGWLALGSGATWTSRDGKTWLLAAGTGIGPLQAGDRVVALARTGSGFIAAGENVPRTGSSSPVIWTSPNGLSWQRLAGGSLSLAAPGGHVLRLTALAAHLSNVIIQGVIATAPHGRGKNRVPGRLTEGVWQSSNQGASWAPASIPVGTGADPAIDGVAATGSGFVVIRPGGSKNTGPDAVAYASTDGTSWSRAGTITAAKKDNLRVTAVSGSDQGAVVSALTSNGTKVAYLSSDGSSWQSVASLGGAGQTLAGLTVTTGGTVVAAGASLSGPEGQQPYLVTAGAAGTQASVVSFAGIKGATGPALAVNGIAAAGRQQVAVGSANGFPAAWSSARAGHWSRASSAALGRSGLSALTDVIHGPAGWLAVGGVIAAAPAHPIVVTSPDGTSWQAADGQSAFGGPGISVYQAAAGRAGYVVVGTQVTPAHTVRQTTFVHRHKKVTSHFFAARTVAAAWWSTGLASWSRAGDAGAGDLDGPGVRQMFGVTAGGGGFVGVGTENDAPAVWTSPDGKQWQLTGLRAPNGASSAVLTRVAAIGNAIVATGTQTTPGGSLPFAEYSSDGGTVWQQATLSAPGGTASVTGLTAAGRGFTAVGTVGPQGDQRVVVWSSRDGATWLAHEPPGAGLSGPGTQAITALTAWKSALIGAGFTATAAGEEPTLWKAAAGSG